MIIALITKENNPRVIMVIGNDKIDKIGLTIILRIPKTIAKIIVDPKLSKCTPFKILLNKKAETAVIKRRIINLIAYFLMFINVLKIKITQSIFF